MTIDILASGWPFGLPLKCSVCGCAAVIDSPSDFTRINVHGSPKKCIGIEFQCPACGHKACIDKGASAPIQSLSTYMPQPPPVPPVCYAFTVPYCTTSGSKTSGFVACATTLRDLVGLLSRDVCGFKANLTDGTGDIYVFRSLKALGDGPPGRKVPIDRYLNDSEPRGRFKEIKDISDIPEHYTPDAL